MNELTKIELSPEECRQFIQFQKRYAFMQLLESIDAFGIKSGSFTVHFDRFGGIIRVEKIQNYEI